MKFAICNETFVDLDWPHEKVFEYIAQFGYTGVEIAPFTICSDARTISTDEVGRIRMAAENAGIQIIGLHWLLSNTDGLLLTSSDSDVRKRTADYLATLARLCRDLGGEVMVFGSPRQRNRPDQMSMHEGFKNALQTLRQVVPVLEETGVTLAMEPLASWETNFLLNADDTRRLSSLVDSASVRMMLDCKAMWAMEPVPIPDVIRNYRNEFVHFHANDPNLLGPGFGDLDFGPVLQALKDIQYARWVSVEVFDYSPGPERIATESLEYLQKCLKTVSADKS